MIPRITTWPPVSRTTTPVEHAEVPIDVLATVIAPPAASSALIWPAARMRRRGHGATTVNGTSLRCAGGTPLTSTTAMSVIVGETRVSAAPPRSRRSCVGAERAEEHLVLGVGELGSRTGSARTSRPLLCWRSVVTGAASSERAARPAITAPQPRPAHARASRRATATTASRPRRGAGGDARARRVVDARDDRGPRASGSGSAGASANANDGRPRSANSRLLPARRAPRQVAVERSRAREPAGCRARAPSSRSRTVVQFTTAPCLRSPCAP